MCVNKPNPINYILIKQWFNRFNNKLSLYKLMTLFSLTLFGFHFFPFRKHSNDNNNKMWSPYFGFLMPINQFIYWPPGQQFTRSWLLIFAVPPQCVVCSRLNSRSVRIMCAFNLHWRKTLHGFGDLTAPICMPIAKRKYGARATVTQRLRLPYLMSVLRAVPIRDQINHSVTTAQHTELTI